MALAFIYFNYKDSDGHTLANLFSSLVHQLLLLHGQVPAELAELYERYNSKGMRPSVHELTSLLRAAVKAFTKTLVVIDALDECPEKDGVREILISELLSLQPQVQLLVTSRTIPMIERQLENARRIDIQASDEDIKTYISERIRSSGKMKGYFEKDPDLRDKITQTIVSKAGGMFLQVRLHLDSLMAKTNLRKLKTALDSLPEGLDETYDEVVERINAQNADESALAWKVLGWILHSARPLTVIELQHALAVEPGDSYLDDDSITDEKLLTSVCAGIVTVQNESETIGLVHFTTQRYLLKNSKRLFPEMEKEMVQSLVDYLSLDEFNSGPCDLGQPMQRRRQNYPLYSYASRHWGVHAMLQTDQGLINAIIAFLDDKQKLASSIQIVSIQAQEVSEIPPASPRSVSAIGVASFFGLEAVVKLLIERGDNVNIRDGYGLTPLHQSDHPGVTKLLLDSGANVAAEDGYGRTPLHQAAWQGAVGVMEVLLARGASLAVKNEMGNSALHEATQNEKLNSVRFLLERNSRHVNARNIYGITPLHLASRQGNHILVTLLLEHGADCQATTDYGESALSMAALRGHEIVIRLLLAKESAQGIQPSRPDDIVVKSLLGAQEVNDTDTQGRTVLHLVCAGGTLRYMEELLRRGADPHALDKQRRTCLHHAATAGSSKAMKCLLDVGLDPHKQDLDGWTPLHWAAKGGKIGNIQLLLESGADPTVKSEAGWTPLAVARYQGLKSAVGALEAAQRSFTHNTALPDLKKLAKSPSSSSPSTRSSPSSSEPIALMNHASSEDLPMLLSNVQSSIGRAFIHRGIICDGCDLDVYDPRYKCMDCADFDFCFKCVKSAAVAHPDHRFQCINLAQGSVSAQTSDPKNIDRDIEPAVCNPYSTTKASADSCDLSLEDGSNNGTIDVQEALDMRKPKSEAEGRRGANTEPSEQKMRRQKGEMALSDQAPLKPATSPASNIRLEKRSEVSVNPEKSVDRITVLDDEALHSVHWTARSSPHFDGLEAIFSIEDSQTYHDIKAQGVCIDGEKLDHDLEEYKYKFGQGERGHLRDFLISKRLRAQHSRFQGTQDASNETGKEGSTSPTYDELDQGRTLSGRAEDPDSESSLKTTHQNLDYPTPQQRRARINITDKQWTPKIIGPTAALIEGKEWGRYRGVTGRRYSQADVARRNSWDGVGMDDGMREEIEASDHDRWAAERRKHDKRRESIGSNERTSQ